MASQYHGFCYALLDSSHERVHFKGVYNISLNSHVVYYSKFLLKRFFDLNSGGQARRIRGSSFRREKGG